jgi:Transposase, Mutator family
MVARTGRRAANAAARYEHAYPAAVTCLTSTRDELTVYLRLPRQHRQRIRPANLLMRSFGETRQRTKTIGRFPVERSCTESTRLPATPTNMTRSGSKVSIACPVRVAAAWLPSPISASTTSQPASVSWPSSKRVPERCLCSLRSVSRPADGVVFKPQGDQNHRPALPSAHRYKPPAGPYSRPDRQHSVALFSTPPLCRSRLLPVCCPERRPGATPAQRREPARPVTSEHVGVEVRGFEPLASSVRVSGSPPLCRPAFSEVALDRRG